MEISNFISEFDHLPKDVQQQVMDYLEFLLSKYTVKTKKVKKEFRFDWEGGLKDMKHKYSSVDLQHLTNELR